MKNPQKDIHNPRYIKLNYSRITPYIFIGTNKCCFPRFDKRLKKVGIKAGVNLEEKRLGMPTGLDFYLWLPVADHEPPTMDQLFIGAKFLKEVVDRKIKVYVHCSLGHTRSPTLVAAYLIHEGMTVKQAIATIKKKRRIIHPTKKQINALEKFYGMVNKDKNPLRQKER